jgi:hypothetical protein
VSVSLVVIPVNEELAGVKVTKVHKIPYWTKFPLNVGKLEVGRNLNLTFYL